MSNKKTIVVTQKKSPIGRQSYQKKTLIGLGLNKIGRVKELEDTLRKYGGGKGFAIKVNNGTIAPREFQRPESWKNKHRKAFFVSLLLVRVEGTLVLVDVETALRKILKTFPNDRAVHLFQSLLEAGYKWIIMDGNNLSLIHI